MKKTIVALTAFLFLTLSLTAQTVDEILNQYFEKTGGKDAWKELNAMKMSGTSSMQGMEFPITLYTKRPNYEKLEIEVQGMQIIEAYDGTTAWSVNPFQGITSATKADDALNKEAAKKSFEDELLDYAGKGHTVEKLEDHEIEGAQVFQLKLTKSSGDEQIYFFDQEKYVPVMIKSFANAGPMKGQMVETYLSDYKEVEKLIIPHSITQKINGQVLMQATMNTIELNPQITNDLFKFPVPVEIPAEKKKMEEVPAENKEIKPQKTMMEDQPKTLEKRKSENPVKN